MMHQLMIHVLLCRLCLLLASKESVVRKANKLGRLVFNRHFRNAQVPHRSESAKITRRRLCFLLDSVPVALPIMPNGRDQQRKEQNRLPNMTGKCEFDIADAGCVKTAFDPEVRIEVRMGFNC
jgi:hypothetical protein